MKREALPHPKALRVRHEFPDHVRLKFTLGYGHGTPSSLPREHEVVCLRPTNTLQANLAAMWVMLGQSTEREMPHQRGDLRPQHGSCNANHASHVVGIPITACEMYFLHSTRTAVSRVHHIRDTERPAVGWSRRRYEPTSALTTDSFPFAPGGFIVCSVTCSLMKSHDGQVMKTKLKHCLWQPDQRLQG